VAQGAVWSIYIYISVAIQLSIYGELDVGM